MMHINLRIFFRSSFSLFCGSGSGSIFDADPDPASHQGDANLRPLALNPPGLHFLSLQASILSVHGPPRIHSDPRKLLNFDFNADPDPQL